MPTSEELLPEVVSVEAGSAADRHGVVVGDRVAAVNGVVPRDILEWVRLVDEPDVELTVVRGHDEVTFSITRDMGQSFGVGISSAVFDRVQTCDNHCEFCFIYQLPKGMRRSLYLKDDDYRLSFLFGNFTTLTRFTEADAERVVSEQLSPLHVSIHAVAPQTRAEMLRNDRGGFSLRWAKFLMEHGISVKAQIVLCPGVNDGEVLDDTFARLLEEMPGLDTIAVVPLGLSRHNTESRMRVHTSDEAGASVDQIERWSNLWMECTGRRAVYAADELYLVAGRDVPASAEYGDFSMLEDGIGLVRSFIDGFTGLSRSGASRNNGFFASVDGTGYVRAANPAADTALRRVADATSEAVPVSISDRSPRLPENRAITVLTGEYAAPILRESMIAAGFSGVEVVAVPNSHFGGNTAVAGLITAHDLRSVLEHCDPSRVYVLPDVCLNNGRFLDDVTLDELSATHEVVAVPTDGAIFRRLLEARKKVAHRVN